MNLLPEHIEQLSEADHTKMVRLYCPSEGPCEADQALLTMDGKYCNFYRGEKRIHSEACPAELGYRFGHSFEVWIPHAGIERHSEGWRWWADVVVLRLPSGGGAA